MHEQSQKSAGTRRNPEPLSYTIPDALAVSGLGRTKLYELAGKGKIQLIKVGRRSLITAASLRALVEGEAA